MNKGFSYYRKKAKQTASFALKKQGLKGKLSYSFYSIVSVVCKLFVFLRPIFAIADNNIARMIEEGHNFSLEKAFDGVTKRYSKLLVPSIVIELKGLAIMLFMSAAGVPFLIFFGALNEPFVTLGYILFIVLVVVGVIAVISYLLNFVSIGYAASKGTDLDSGDILLCSKRAMKGNKWKFIGNALAFYLVRILVLGAIIGIFELYTIGLFSSISAELFFVLYGILILVYLALLIFVLIPKNLVYEQSKYLFFTDTVQIKKTVVVKQIPGEKVEYSPIFSEGKDEKDLLDLTK